MRSTLRGHVENIRAPNQGVMQLEDARAEVGGKAACPNSNVANDVGNEVVRGVSRLLGMWSGQVQGTWVGIWGWKGRGRAGVNSLGFVWGRSMSPWDGLGSMDSGGVRPPHLSRPQRF